MRVTLAPSDTDKRNYRYLHGDVWLRVKLSSTRVKDGGNRK